ncbi:MAG: hypothetical protein Sapg2KO_48540 [Saprospiraceae bacterium]
MEVLKKGEYTGDIVSRLSLDGNIITNTHYSTEKNNPHWHAHENFHISFVFQGGKAETSRSTTYGKKTGTIFAYHAGEKHRWISNEGVSKSANIEIGSSFLKRYSLSECEIKESLYTNVDTKAIILKIQSEMMFKGTDSTNSIQSLLLELVSGSSEVKKRVRPQWIKDLTVLLHDNWNDQITLKEMSEIVGVHPVTISKYFRNYFSCTLGEYQRKLKIEQSIELIKHSDQSLSEIAFFCGFADQSHFIRNFKKMTGFLPKHFQKL